MLSFIYDPARFAMTTDASSPPKGSRNIPPSPKLLSPAEAIAEAWKRETEESKARWRRIDEDVRRRYTNPHRKKERKTKL
ncbi:uncharacterized protein EV420DRAFT_1639845 [Desarmillaria tabescens]|uniref:Uncharacterized protein n=1 Tax=Armillaria tabescens TaxID=1929756 RepID=A0AA39TKS8_ARMTA|nr:uncharacterized protein EV420DRAFT_1639845 [Desarmillaria tabescens]KAK0462627.1 hypothetical protein EV420DRAFT_1639845 [Desarmillaria tabescens]